MVGCLVGVIRTGVVVVEEAVQARAVDVDVAGIDNAQTQRFARS